MQEEARNTEGRNLWRSGVQFRHKNIQFVSAGSLEPAQEPCASQSTKEAVTEMELPTMTGRCMSETRHASVSNPDVGHFSGISTTSLMAPYRRRSDTSEGSSEDEVLFRGRRNRPNISSRTYDTITDNDVPQKVTADDKTTTFTEPPTLSADVSLDFALSPHFKESSTDWIYLQDDSATGSTGVSENGDILADYIAHIDSDIENDKFSIDAQQQEDDEASTSQDQLMRGPRTQEGEDIDLEYPDSFMPEVLNEETDGPFPGPSGSPPNKPSNGIFASATAFADALELDPYYGLDIMDFNRPSLSKNKKQKKSISFETYNKELEDELINSWNNDRSKKRLKKREREDLRAQGLLGRPKDNPDLQVKYANGMDINDLKFELRSFMLSRKNRYAHHHSLN